MKKFSSQRKPSLVFLFVSVVISIGWTPLLGQSCPDPVGSDLSAQDFYDRIEGPQPISAPGGTYTEVTSNLTKDQVQALIDNASEGSTFYFRAGDYYMGTLKLKNGMTLIGENGARFLGTTTDLENGWVNHLHHYGNIHIRQLKSTIIPDRLVLLFLNAMMEGKHANGYRIYSSTGNGYVRLIPFQK